MAHATYIFNPLDYAHKLEKAGVKKEVAEVQAQLQFELIENQAVTKADITELRMEIKNIEIKLGRMMAAGVIFLGGLMALFHFVK